MGGFLIFHLMDLRLWRVGFVLMLTMWNGKVFLNSKVPW